MGKIRLGCTYKESDLESRKRSGNTVLQHTVAEKPYGYFITITTSYITIKKTRLEINADGTAKAVTKVNKNYSSPYQFTTYFDKEGREIIGDTTHQELSYYKKIRKGGIK